MQSSATTLVEAINSVMEHVNRQEAIIKRLRDVLASLRAEQLEPDEWGIKCIEDHNAIIDEALRETDPNKQ